MYPTYQNSDVIKAHRYGDIERFDVIIMQSNDDNEDNPYYLKRIIGLPGDTIEYKDGVLYVNEEEVADDFANQTADIAKIFIPSNMYYVLGDNRSISKDSRYFGCVEIKDIIGIIKKENSYE